MVYDDNCCSHNPDYGDYLEILDGLVNKLEGLTAEAEDRLANLRGVLHGTSTEHPAEVLRICNLDEYYTLSMAASGDILIVEFPKGCDTLRQSKMWLSEPGAEGHIDCNFIVLGEDLIGPGSNVVTQLRVDDTGKKAALYVLGVIK